MAHKQTTLESLQQNRRKQENLFGFLEATSGWGMVLAVSFSVFGFALLFYEKVYASSGISNSFAVELWSIQWWRKGIFILAGLSHAYCFLMYPVRCSLAKELGKDEPEI